MPPEEPRPDTPTEADGRQRLTILFTDLSDSTHLSTVMEAEVYADMLDAVRRIFVDEVRQRGGTINQFQGDGLQAVFGYPQPTERDGQHAVEAALAVHERVRELRPVYATQGAPSVSVHSGIHGGLMLARAGDSVAGRVELFGAAPGLAKHLSDIADEDQILASEETLGPAGLLFETSARRLVALKGRQEPLAVHRILGRTRLKTRYEAHVRRGLLPFIGRLAERQRLTRAFARLRDGVSALVAVRAPAGMGKTRLIEEFLGQVQAEQGRVLRGYCEADLSAEPLQPFLQMLRSALGVPIGADHDQADQALVQALRALDPALEAVHGELQELLSITPPAAHPAAARGKRPGQSLAALARVFGALAAGQPLLLFIDDWQWADDATRQLAYALAAQRGRPTLVLLATRPSDTPEVAGTMPLDVIDLGPLSDAESDATLAELLPAADPFVAARIRRQAGGNPLFLEELCHSAALQDPAGASDQPPSSSAWLEALIGARVARLPREQQDILGAAAVIGTLVPATALQALTGHDEDDPAVRELAQGDLLFPGEHPGTLRFKHGITREVVYAAVSLQRRRAWHAQLAALLQAQPDAPPALLAYHHQGAGQTEDAARCAEQAGDRAMASSSLDRAKSQYRAALDMLDRLPASEARYAAWRSIVRRLGLACVFDPARSELALFARAVDRAREHQDPAGQAYAQYWLAYVNYALGESRAAVAHCQLALQGARETGDAWLSAQVRTTLGQAYCAAAVYPQALELLADTDRILADPNARERRTPGLAYSLACKASALGDLGRFDEAHASFEQALAALPGPGHEVEGSVLCWRSGVFLWQGQWTRALQDAVAAQAVAQRVRSLYLYGMSRGLGAYAEWQIDPGPRPLKNLVDAAAWLESRDKGLFGSLLQGWLAEAYTAGGRAAEARHHAARALGRVRHGDWLGAAMASRAMVRLCTAREDWRGAERHLARAERVARRRDSAHETAANLACRAELWLARDRIDEARAAADDARDAFQRLGMDWHRARLASLRVRLGLGDGAG